MCHHSPSQGYRLGGRTAESKGVCLNYHYIKSKKSSSEVLIEILSFKGTQAIKISKILPTTGFILHMILKIIPSVLIQNKKKLENSNFLPFLTEIIPF